jgi:hypothetical protein
LGVYNHLNSLPERQSAPFYLINDSSKIAKGDVSSGSLGQWRSSIGTLDSPGVIGAALIFFLLYAALDIQLRQWRTRKCMCHA